MQIGYGSNQVKVGSLISQVTGNPDWINLESVTDSVTSTVKGIAAKVGVPAGHTMQILSNSNYWLSKLQEGVPTYIGRILNQTTTGSSTVQYQKYTSTGYVIDSTVMSELIKAESVYDDWTQTVSYLDSSTSNMVVVDANSANFVGAITSFVGPYLTFRNNGTETREILVGLPRSFVNTAYGTQPWNALLSFRLAPNAFIDNYV